jgi:hypothetical protein
MFHWICIKSTLWCNFYMLVVRRDICYGVVRLCVRASFRGHFSFSDFFLPSLQLLHWNLVYCFVVMSYSSSLRFSVIDSFLQELCSWNFEEFTNFSVFRTFFGYLWRYKIETWLIDLQFQFAFQCDWYICASVIPLEVGRI